MKKIKHIIALVLLIIIGFGFTENEGCEILKNNNFTYKNGGNDVFVVFKNDKYIEYHNKRKYFIKADIDWVSTCEYYLVIKESTIPNFPFSSGEKMHIKVDKIKGKNVYYTCSLGGRSWEGKLTKSKKTE